MTSSDMQRWLLHNANVRVGPHTADYAARQSATLPAPAPFYVIGVDPRTGRPLRTLISSTLLAQLHTPAAVS